MYSRERTISIDPLGFTNQTATILCGLGGNDLVPEFKKRNISTEVLYKLTKEDFMQLGANEKHAEKMISELRVMRKRNLEDTFLKFDAKAKELFQILQNGQRQLSLIQAFIAYCRLRLVKEQINFYIDPDKNLCASKALCIAARATLEEINDTEKHLRDLKMYISQNCAKPKSSYFRISIVVTAISLTACVMLRRYKIP